MCLTAVFLIAMLFRNIYIKWKSKKDAWMIQDHQISIDPKNNRERTNTMLSGKVIANTVFGNFGGRASHKSDKSVIGSDLGSRSNEGFTEDEFYKTGSSDQKKREIELPAAPHCRIALYRLSEQTEPKIAAVKPIEPMLDVKRLRKVSLKKSSFFIFKYLAYVIELFTPLFSSSSQILSASCLSNSSKSFCYNNTKITHFQKKVTFFYLIPLCFVMSRVNAHPKIKKKE